MTTTPRDVLGYTAKLPRYDGATDAAPLLLPAWVRAGGSAFAISIDQMAALVGAVLPAPAEPEGLLPEGGAPGQILRRTGVGYEWATLRPLPGGGTTGQVLQKTADEWYAVGWASASGLGGTATVTVPNARYEHQESITATGVTPTSRVTLSLSAMDDEDENAPDMLDIASIGAVPGTDAITVLLSFGTPASGPIPINWSAS